MKRDLGLSLLMLSLVLEGCGRMDAAAVSQEQTKLASTVAESRLLAESAADGRLTVPFVAVRTSELADDARAVESALNDPAVSPGARAEAHRLRTAAEQAVAAMEQLNGRPADRAVASEVAVRLGEVASELRGP